jgi:hypothetical protein
MENILYPIWSLIPFVLFLMSLWSYLEKVGGKKKQERPGDLFKQGLFTTGCVLASVVIDQYLLPSLDGSFLTDFVPFGVFRVILFPFVLFVAAYLIGPTKDILISKAPSASSAYKKK